MSTKPPTVPTWATDTNYPAGAAPYAGTPTKVATTLGQKAVGWEPAGKPPAQNMNAWMHSVGLWCGYLSDGVLDGNHQITGDLDLDQDLAVAGDATIAGAVVIGGAGSIGGALGVGGTLLVEGAAAFEESVELQGEVLHAIREMSLEPRGEFGGAGTGSTLESSDIATYTLSTLGGSLRIPCDELTPGDRIQRVFVAFTSPGGYPDVEVVLGGFGAAPTTLAVTAGGTQTISGIKVQEYIVNVPTALGVILGLAPIRFAQRASVKVTAASNTTVLYGVALTYDRVTIPNV